MQGGLIFNIQRYSIQDGPGIRTTVFLKGCPLRCAWCHNPEGLSPKPELLVTEARCIGCLECHQACPHAHALPEDRPLPLGMEGCKLCGACVEACPTGARCLVGKELTVSELIEQLLPDQVFYEVSRGGVTFSGGEPLMQPEFLNAALAACRSHGLHTAVDTCGLAPREQVLAMAAQANLVLYDVKLMDEVRHRQVTGVSNRPILDNLLALGEVHECIWVRVPVVPGINDAAADLEALAAFVASVPGVRQVNLLPFHRIGVDKSRRLGRSSPAEQFQPPSAEQMTEAWEIFQKRGFSVTIGG